MSPAQLMDMILIVSCVWLSLKLAQVSRGVEGRHPDNRCFSSDLQSVALIVDH